MKAGKYEFTQVAHRLILATQLFPLDSGSWTKVSKIIVVLVLSSYSSTQNHDQIILQIYQKQFFWNFVLHKNLRSDKIDE